MKRSIGRYPVRVIAIAVVMILTGSVSAWAHYLANTGEVWTSDTGSHCLDARGEISHGIGYGYSKTDAWAYKPGVEQEPCWLRWYVAPNYLSAKNYLQKKTSSGSWAECRSDGTAFNTTTDYHVVNPQYWQAAGSQAWCGHGTYRTRGYVSVLYSGARRYGNIYSPAHTL